MRGKSASLMPRSPIYAQNLPSTRLLRAARPIRKRCMRGALAQNQGDLQKAVTLLNSTRPRYFLIRRKHGLRPRQVFFGIHADRVARRVGHMDRDSVLEQA